MSAALSPPERWPWMVDAACMSVGGELFHVGKGESNREAKTVCQGCTVREQCLIFAMNVEIDSYRTGVFGGLSGLERGKLAKTGWQPGDPIPDVRVGWQGEIRVCPECGKGSRSLRQHRAQAHGIRSVA